MTYNVFGGTLSLTQSVNQFSPTSKHFQSFLLARNSRSNSACSSAIIGADRVASIADSPRSKIRRAIPTTCLSHYQSHTTLWKLKNYTIGTLHYNWSTGLAWYIWPIYIIDIYPRYIQYCRWKISDIFEIFDFYQVFKKVFNVTYCDYVLIFSPCVLLAYDLCPQHFLSVGQLLSDCTSLQQCSVNDKSTSPNMQSTHTYYYLVICII